MEEEMKFSITKKFEFEAAHILPNHPGKCMNLHGHSYKLEVTISTKELDSQGMVMDFGDLKEIVNSHIIEIFDHSYLNDSFDNPTAEEMAKWIYSDLSVFISEAEKKRVKVDKVRLYETSNSYTEVVE